MSGLEIIIEIGAWILIGIGVALFTYLFEYVIGSPWKDHVNTKAIFSFYGLWLHKKYEQMQNKIAMNQAPSNAHTQLNWYSAIGACPYCINVHFANITAIGVALGGSLHWWGWFIVAAVAHFVLCLVMDFLEYR